MNSVKTKSKDYSLVNGKAIGGVVLVPKNGYFNVYVAWEWEDQAKNKFFAIIEGSHLVGNDTLTSETISNMADYGRDVTHDENVRKHFPRLF